MTAVTRIASTAEAAPPIRATDLARRRGGRLLWSSQTFDVAAGTSLAITGPSGSGKSTLLNCIGLLDQPDGGTLEIDGFSAKNISRRRRQLLLQTSVGHLFQNYGLVETWSADQNIDVAFTGRRVSRKERQRVRRAALERVDLASYGPRRVHELSGGEQQRIALARILVKSPRIIVADEPSAALDADNVAMVLSVLDELRAAGAAIVVATHDDSIAEWCDREIRLERPSLATGAEVSDAER